jgi:hypothetical protein
MNALEYVPPQRLRGAWLTIRPAVEQIRTTCSEPWLTEDVYAALAFGAAQLWARPEFDGWAIVKTQVIVEPVLLVWLAWSRPGTSDVVAENTEQLREIARQAGIGTLAFESPRIGWERRAPALGWRAQMTRWVMEA